MMVSMAVGVARHERFLEVSRAREAQGTVVGSQVALQSGGKSKTKNNKGKVGVEMPSP